MKIPTLIQGVTRKNRRDRVVGSTGILAQECEDECAENFDPGSDEYDDCVDDCDGEDGGED